MLLHGWGMNGAVWDDLAAALAPEFRVHCVDLPGHGASATCVPYTPDAIIATISARLPARCIVCGWSLGAQVALAWARQLPDQVTHLVVIAGTPRFVNGAGWSYGIEPEVFEAFAADLERDPRAALERFLALQARGDDDAREVLRYLRSRALHGPAPEGAALAAGLAILGSNDLRGMLPRISQPALVVHGTRDALVPFAAARFVRAALPNGTLAKMEGAAHVPFATRAPRLARSIAEFVREH